MNPSTDEQLLADHLAGRSGQFELLVERHSPELYRFLARFTGSATTADDIVQETFLQVHLSAETFDRSRRFKPWLFTIAANKARDWMRSRARKPEVPLDAHVGNEQDEGQRFLHLLADEMDAPSIVLEDKEQQEIVRQVVEDLPDNLREVLVLNYFQHFAYKEIAEMLDVPLGTVKSRLHAAVRAFGQAYQAALRERA